MIKIDVGESSKLKIESLGFDYSDADNVIFINSRGTSLSEMLDGVILGDRYSQDLLINTDLNSKPSILHTLNYTVLDLVNKFLD